MRAIGWPGAKVVQKTVSRLAGKKLAHLQPERMGARAKGKQLRSVLQQVISCQMVRAGSWLARL